MGTFYGSVLVRAENSNVVRKALEVVAKNSKSRFLLGPALNGWVSVFPNDAGQNDRVSAEIAKELPNDILHLAVHDDDIFSYYVYRNGRLADRYNSCPDHFGPVSSDEKKQCVGHPEVFEHLLPNANAKTLEKLKKLLTKQKFTFEQERMTEFVALLDLPNAMSSYEYLQSGERDGIKGWEQFVHIPDLAPEIAARQATQAQIENEKGQLQKTGLLLAEISPPKEGKTITAIAWGTDSSSNGLLLVWQSFDFGALGDAAPKMAEFQSLQAPWELPARPLGLKTNATATVFSTSPSGKWLAGGFVAGDWTARVWDWRDKKLAFEVTHSRAVGSVEFSRDDQFVYSLGGDEFIVSSLKEKGPVKTIKGVEGSRAAAVHPSGNFASLALQGGLAIVDLNNEKVTKQLRVNRRMEKMDRWPSQPDDVVAQKLIQNPEKLKKMGVKSQKELESWIKEKRFLTFETQEQVFDLGFSPDGTQLFIASKGIRVFDWEKILAAKDDAPPPQFCVDAPKDDEYDPNSRPLAYSVRFDPERNLVLSGCLAGTVQYLSLATGHSGTLLEVPGEMAIGRLELTTDGKALCCDCAVRPRRKDRLNDERSPCLQIWNYPVLCKAAGLG
jgi:WD40 repeat protein